jgi:hypothetical protein
VVERVIENWQQALQTIVQSQQEMFRKWVGLWSGMPLLPIARSEEVQKFQQQWPVMLLSRQSGRPFPLRSPTQ